MEETQCSRPVSNFTRPGFRCRHNTVYWEAEEYFAFGPGAARYVNGIRSTNSRNVTRWINSWLQKKPAIQDFEQLSTESRAREALFLALRLCEGIDLGEFERRFFTSIQDLADAELRQHLSAGNLEIVDGHLRLTRDGRFIADSVIADFL